MDQITTDYLIIGSGIAGLRAGLELSKYGNVLIATKGDIQGGGSTSLAQGGIASVTKESDREEYHYEDTIKAGAGLCDEEAVRILVKEGPKRVRELVEWGAPFDRYGEELSLHKEAAHSKRRILHAGDRTGYEIEKTLGRKILSEGKVKFYEQMMIIELLLEDEICIGARGIDIKNKKEIIIKAEAVMIATGGFCQMFAYNTNPPQMTGDGIALAWEAGAEIMDMEFIQFHPTTLNTGDKRPVSIFLISEAVRGEGAFLRDLHGKRFMKNYHKLLELAPRDVVARAIYSEMKKQKSGHVYLDLTSIKGNLHQKFPTIYERCREAKIDINKDFIPVSPAAHYAMGGVRIDYKGRTNVSGLFASGEVTSVGIHGANRLASNSLLDGLVFGYRAAQTMNDYSKGKSVQRVKRIKGKKKYEEFDVSRLLTIKQELRDLMWQNVGIVREGKLMKEALKKSKGFYEELNINSNNPNLIEVKNMILTARLVAEFAIEREESRGAHYRKDYPKTDDKDWKRHIIKSSENLKVNC